MTIHNYFKRSLSDNTNRLKHLIKALVSCYGQIKAASSLAEATDAPATAFVPFVHYGCGSCDSKPLQIQWNYKVKST